MADAAIAAHTLRRAECDNPHTASILIRYTQVLNRMADAAIAAHGMAAGRAGGMPEGCPRGDQEGADGVPLPNGRRIPGLPTARPTGSERIGDGPLADVRLGYQSSDPIPTRIACDSDRV
jgi:hypothetical protein